MLEAIQTDVVLGNHWLPTYQSNVEGLLCARWRRV